MRRLVRLTSPIALMCCVFAISASAQHRAFFDYPTTTDSVLVDYAVEYGKVAEEDRFVSIRVFGDGRVELYRPFWHARAGSYSIQLTDDEIQRLLDDLLTAGALHFDPAKAQAKCRREDQRRFADRGQTAGTSADSWVHLSVRVDAYQSPGAAAVEGPVDRQIAWRNLEWAAENYPSIPALEELRAATRTLDALWKRQDLVEDLYRRGE